MIRNAAIVISTPGQFVLSRKPDLHGHHHAAASQRPDGLHLKVGGMSCAGCAAAVQRSIEHKPGVESAMISVTDGRATIIGRDIDPNEIVNAIQNAGYTAEVIDDLPAPAELRSEIEQRQAEHEHQWRSRAVIGLSFWVPLEVLHWIAHVNQIHSAWVGWVMMIGATIVMATAGSGFFKSAWNAAKRRTTNMDTLIAMGATTAYVFSMVVFIGQLLGRLHDQPLYFAESAALLGIISLGHWMEARATARAGSAVRELLELQPEEAEIVSNGESRMVQSSEVQPGDHILIRPGGRVPVDGMVIEGESEIDEAVVTGESMPVRKSADDSVIAGSMNTTGRLVIRATVDGRHTTVARIAEMVQRAQSSKANIQRLADRVSAIFVPTVLIIAGLTLIGWALAGDFSTGIVSTVSVLIISCPCALGLATPMAVMVGAGAASKRGILIKSAMALETAGRTSHVIFDKTGTLTAGQPIVTHIESKLPEDQLLRFAAAVEQASEHPIAKAIVRAAKQRGIAIPHVDRFQAIPGEGVRGTVDGKTVMVMRDDQATCRVIVDDQVVGAMTITDQLRRDAKDVVARLKSMNITMHILSGDRKHAAEAVARELGIDAANVTAEATPARKVNFVAQQAARSDESVMMVGDGINDAAALAQADLGIAMAGGTNIAIESADVVIPGDRVSAVADTVLIARQTLRTIKQNLFFAFFYNAAAIPAAALGLLGPFGPLIAAAAMGFSDITVIGNAIRLKRKLNRKMTAG